MGKMRGIAIGLFLVASVVEHAHAAYTWTHVPTETYTGVAASDQYTFAVGGMNYTKKTQGGEWRPLTQGPILQFKDVVWSGTQFVALKDHEIRVNTTGSSWPRKLITGDSNPIFRYLFAHDDSIYAYTANHVHVSHNGGDTFAQWSIVRPSGTSGTSECTRFAQVNDTLACVPNKHVNYVLTSMDGITWSKKSLPRSAALRDIVAIGSQLGVLATYADSLGSHTTTFASFDGSDWDQYDLDTVATHEDGPVRMVYGEEAGAIVIVPEEGNWVLCRTTGVSWTYHSLPFTLHARALAWNGSEFVAVGLYGEMATSTDGKTWSLYSQQVPNRKVVWSFNDQFYALTREAVGPGKVYRSKDGFVWDYTGTVPTTQIQGVSYRQDPKVTVAFGKTWIIDRYYEDLDDLTVVTIDKAHVMERRTLPFKPASFTFDGTTLIAGSSNGNIYTTTNGESWQHVSSGFSRTIHRINALYGRYFAATSKLASGTIYTATNLSSLVSTGVSGGHVASNGEQFFILDKVQSVWSSYDGINWNSARMGAQYGETVHAAAGNAHLAVAAGKQGLGAHVISHGETEWVSMPYANWFNQGSDPDYPLITSAAAADDQFMLIGEGQRVIHGVSDGTDSTTPTVPDPDTGTDPDTGDDPDPITDPGTDPDDSDDVSSSTAGSGGGGSFSWSLLALFGFVVARCSVSRRARGSHA